MSGAFERRSIFFQLRGMLCVVLMAMLLFERHPLPPLLWAFGTAYLLSNLLIRFFPVKWFEHSGISYALVLLDLAGVSIILYGISGFGSDSLLLFYVTVLIATLGENVPKGLGIAFGASALYIWLQMRAGSDLLGDAATLLRIPLFLVTALTCAYLAQEVRQQKLRVRGLREAEKTLETELMRSSEELARSESLRTAAQELARRFSDLLQDLNAVVWEMEVPTFRITFISQQAERILGYPAEKWLRERDFWTEHIHPDDRARVEGLCRKAVAEGRDYEFEYRALSADRKVVWLQDIVRLIRDDAGRVRQLRGVMVDITERKQLEEEFFQSQKMEAVGRLAGGVAHDFNNLLTIITGYTQLLLEQVALREPLREFADEIHKAGERAAALTRRLLAFSRKQALSPQILDVNALLAGMEKMLRQLVREDVELVITQGPGLGTVKADPAQIEQVVMNLAVNARDAMPRGGKLIIETANIELDQAYARSHPAIAPGPYVLLAVSDVGTGIAPEALPHIFEPFFTTKEKGKGTGLGLATVYGIVKQSGGNVWVYSELGRGTTFKIYLPRVDQVPVPLLAPLPSRKAPQGSETVLLVEDEEGVRALVHGILKSRGYTVLEAGLPSEAVKISQQFSDRIHLLLTDVVMPQMSGRELAKQLSLHRPEVKVLYMSGYTDEAIVHHGVLDPGAPFLQKPFTPDAVGHKVREVLDSGPAGRG